MKKHLFTLLTITACATAAAQNFSDHAIGIRFGNNGGLGADISYQRALSSSNRLEINLGIENDDDFNGFKALGLYQWVWELEDRFNWYAGAGGGLGSVSPNERFRDEYGDNDFFLAMTGQVGIEYHFDIPLQLSLDFRPEFYLGKFRDGYESDIALSARYTF